MPVTLCSFVTKSLVDSLAGMRVAERRRLRSSVAPPTETQSRSVSRANDAERLKMRADCDPKSGSARNEALGDIGAANLSALIEEVGSAIEPERLANISLGQENPRMRMNAAPG